MAAATLTRQAPGLYIDRTNDDSWLVIERDDEGVWGPKGQWFIRENAYTSAEDVYGPYETLKEAKAAL